MRTRCAPTAVTAGSGSILVIPSPPYVDASAGSTEWKNWVLAAYGAVSWVYLAARAQNSACIPREPNSHGTANQSDRILISWQPDFSAAPVGNKGQVPLSSSSGAHYFGRGASSGRGGVLDPGSIRVRITWCHRAPKDLSFDSAQRPRPCMQPAGKHHAGRPALQSLQRPRDG